MPNIGIDNVNVSGSAGVYTITFGNTLGGGNLPALVVNNISLTGNASAPTVTITPGTGGTTTTVSAVVTGSGAIRKEGLSTLVLTGNNTLSNATATAFVIDQGIVNIQSNTALGTAAGTTTVNIGAALQVQGPLVIANKPLVLNSIGYLGLSTFTAAHLEMVNSGGVTAYWGTGAPASTSPRRLSSASTTRPTLSISTTRSHLTAPSRNSGRAR